MGHLVRLLGSTGVDCVIDVGANEGQFAQELRESGFEGEIVSIEPVPETYEVLARRCAVDPRWLAIPVAIGDANREGRLHLSESSTVASLLEMEEWYRVEHPRAAAAGERVVPVRRLDWDLLDQVLPTRPDCLCLKSDTQGYESMVLRGAEQILSAVEIVQIELSVRPVYVGAPDWREMIDCLADLGFELSALFPVAYDRRMCVIEFDGIFRRTER